MSLFFGRDKKLSKGKVITLLNQKGGVGKTTMAFNIAHGLAQNGSKVLCIDMDPQSNLSLLFDVDLSVEEGNSIHHLLVNSVRELKALHTPCTFADVLIEGEGVDLLPAGQELSGLELTVAGISSPRQLILKRFIEKNALRDIYDYIIIDSPPTLGLLVVNILCASQGVVVPFRPDGFSRKGLGHLYDVLGDVEDMGVSDTPEVLVHIPNLVEGRRKQEGEDLDSIEQDLSELESDGNIGKIVSPFFNRAQLVRSHAQKKSVYEYQSKEFAPLKDQFNEIAGIIQQWSSSDS